MSQAISWERDEPETGDNCFAGDIRIERAADNAWLLHARQRLPADRGLLFPFFADATNLVRITPPEMRFEIVTPLPIVMREGALIDYRLRVGGLPVRWRTLISRWDPPHEFVDEQLRGPYAEWHHRHRFTALRDGSTLVEDEVRFRLPFGPLASIAGPLVRRQLRRIFSYRRAAMTRLAPAGERERPVAHGMLGRPMLP